MKRIGIFLRVAICVGLLAFLVRRTDTSALLSASLRSAANWPWLAAGIVATFLGLLVGAIRWGRILAVQGNSFSEFAVIRIFFIGQFFNAFMLGACGGDVVRAYYAAKDEKGRRAETAMTILADRAVGLFSVIAFCCVMIPVRIRVFLDNEGPRDTGVLMLVFLVASVAGVVVLFRRNVFEHSRLFRRIEAVPRLGPLFRRAYEAFYIYKNHSRLLLLSVLLSLLNMACLTLACYAFGMALELDVALIDYFTLFPIVSVLMSVPITPGSLGVREGLFVSLFRAVMVDQPHAILLSLMVYGGGLFWSLAGGAVYLFTKVGNNAPPDAL